MFRNVLHQSLTAGKNFKIAQHITIESAKLRGLRGNVVYVGAWVVSVRCVRGFHESNFYVGCLGYVGLNIFYVVHNFYVGCVGQIYFCLGQIFLCGSIFLRESTFFAWVIIFLRGSKFLRGSIFFVVRLKKINWRFRDNTLVVYFIRIEDMLNKPSIS